MLCDKFGIISNQLNNIEVTKLNNYIEVFFENMLNNNTIVVHPDLLFQIIKFNQSNNYEVIIGKQIENYLKQLKTSIRGSIRKGNYELEIGLNKFIDSYSEKINKISELFGDNTLIKKISYEQLNNHIIQDPSVIKFIKEEIKTLDNNIKPQIKKLYNVIIKIDNFNPDLKTTNWFLYLISTSLEEIVEEKCNQNYPVPEKLQKIINFGETIAFCSKVGEYYNFCENNINVILNNISNIFVQQFIDIMKNSDLDEFCQIIKTHTKFIDYIISASANNIKDIITNNFLILIDKSIPNTKSNKIDINKFILIVESFDILNKILNNINTKDIINNKIGNLISREAIQKSILNYINESIINNYNNKESIINILEYTYFIKDKDKFIDKYQTDLVSRLLYKPNIEIEKIYNQIIRDKFGYKLTVKTAKIIADMEATIDDRINFNKISGLSINPDYITTSYNNWDINQNEGILTEEYIKSNNTFELEKYMDKYNRFYTKRYENKRKLNWYPHFGQVIVDFNIGKSKIELKLLPIQFMILEKVANKKSIILNELFSDKLFENYPHKFRTSVIGSLVFGGILKYNDKHISINMSSNINTDYITIFFTTTNYTTVWEEKRQQELMMNREDIIASWINHFVKKESITFNNLFDKIKNNLKVFELDQDFLTKCLKTAIDKDYIKLESDKYHKILY